MPSGRSGDTVQRLRRVSAEESRCRRGPDLRSDLALTRRWKYAYRLGEISLDREDVSFFDNSASLYVLRTDYRFRENWEAPVEGRTGALLAVSRYFGDHFKAGVGYSFTDFSDDITDLDYNQLLQPLG